MEHPNRRDEDAATRAANTNDGEMSQEHSDLDTGSTTSQRVTDDTIPIRIDREAMLAAALSYVRKGYAVFPLMPYTKKPATSQGFKDATTDEAQIHEWFTGRDRNIGIATGAKSNLLLVDGDLYKPGVKAYPEWQSTVRDRSPRGGHHEWFCYPPGCGLTIGENIPEYGWDFRGEGGYVVAPPSVVSWQTTAADGSTTNHWGQAHWISGSLEGELPYPSFDLLDKLRKVEPANAQPAAPQPTMNVVPGGKGITDPAYWLEWALKKVKPGERSHWCAQMAYQLRDNGVSLEDALATSEKYAESVGALSDHPYTAKEAEGTIRSAYANPRPDRTPSTPSMPIDDSGFPDEPDEIDTTLDAPLTANGTPRRAVRADQRADTAVPSWPPRIQKDEITGESLHDILRAQIGEVQFAVPGLFAEGVTLLVAKPKVGKSWLALGTAIAKGLGTRALGRIKVSKGRVLYLALEDSKKRMQKRTETILGASGKCPDNVDVYFRWEPFDRGGYERMNRYLAVHPDTELVFIDTLQKIRPAPRGRGSYGYDDDYQIMSAISMLAHQHHAAIVVIYHSRKQGSDDPQDMVSGTTGLTGGADSTMVLTRPRGENLGTLFMTGREIEEHELVIKWTPETVTWVISEESADTLMLPERQRVIIEVFRKNGNTPISIANICEAIGVRKDNGRHKMDLVVGRMKDAGVLIRVGLGVYKAADRYVRSWRSTEETQIMRDTREMRDARDAREMRDGAQPSSVPQGEASVAPSPSISHDISHDISHGMRNESDGENAANPDESRDEDKRAERDVSRGLRDMRDGGQRSSPEDSPISEEQAASISHISHDGIKCDDDGEQELTGDTCTVCGVVGAVRDGACSECGSPVGTVLADIPVGDDTACVACGAPATHGNLCAACANAPASSPNAEDSVDAELDEMAHIYLTNDDIPY